MRKTITTTAAIVAAVVLSLGGTVAASAVERNPGTTAEERTAYILEQRAALTVERPVYERPAYPVVQRGR